MQGYMKLTIFSITHSRPLTRIQKGDLELRFECLIKQKGDLELRFECLIKQKGDLELRFECNQTKGRS